MKKSYIVILFVVICLIAVAYFEDKRIYMNNNKPFTEKEVLDELDYAYNATDYLAIYRAEEPYKFEFPKSNYQFFFNLELPYTVVAGSRIHLYADSTSWAIVFEVNGCNIKECYPEVELIYIGNAIDYANNKDDMGNWNANWNCIPLMDFDEIKAIENDEGTEMEQYQLISKDISSIKINGFTINFKNDYKELEKVGIEVRDYENSQKLASFENFVRYLHETQPEVLHIKEARIKKHFFKDIPKLMTIDQFYYTSNNTIESPILPSHQELFQLIAKVLVTKDTSYWKPTLPPNNHWSNWESGFL